MIFLPYLFFYYAIFKVQSFTTLKYDSKVVGLNGLEPSTSRLSGVRSNQLSYKPKIFRGIYIYWVKCPIKID